MLTKEVIRVQAQILITKPNALRKQLWPRRVTLETFDKPRELNNL